MQPTTISTTLAMAASTLLTDLPTVKNELRIDPANTGDDVFLTRTLAEVSDDVARYCNRVFPQETVQDLVFPARDAYPWQIPGGLERLRLSRWPASTAAVTLPLAAPVAAGNVLAFAATAGVSPGMPAALAAAPGPGPQPLPIPLGSFVTSVIQNASVTLNAPVAAPLAAGQGIGFGMAVVVTETPGFPCMLWPGVDYLVDPDAGLLTRLHGFGGYPSLWRAVPTSVTFQGGFAATPPALVGAVLRIVTLRYASRGRDPMLKSRDQPGALGSQTYWIGSIPGVKGAYPEEIADILSRFRVPVTG